MLATTHADVSGRAAASTTATAARRHPQQRPGPMTARRGGALSLVLAALLAAPNAAVIAADADGNYMVWGMGRASCHGFIREHAGDGRYKTYLMGYLTAYNTLVPETYSVSGDHDIAELLDLIENHCHDHGMDSFERAIQQVLGRLHAERLTSAPRPGAGWTR